MPVNFSCLSTVCSLANKLLTCLPLTSNTWFYFWFSLIWEEGCTHRKLFINHYSTKEMLSLEMYGILNCSSYELGSSKIAIDAYYLTGFAVYYSPRNLDYFPRLS